MSKVTFTQCVEDTWVEPRLMSEYRRISGSTIGLDIRTPIEVMIDNAAGRDNTPPSAEVDRFLDFVYEYIWVRLPRGVRCTDPDPVLMAYAIRKAHAASKNHPHD